MTIPIVEAAFLDVGEDGVRLRRLLELFFRSLVVRIPVGMELHRLLAIRALELRHARSPADAEHLVIIALAHAFATFTIAGRSRRSPIM